MSGVFFSLSSRASRAPLALLRARTPPFLPLFMHLPRRLEPEVLWKSKAQANKSLQEDELLSVLLCLRAAFFIKFKLFGCQKLLVFQLFSRSITLYCENRATFS